MSLAFITPAYGRYELTAICLEQKRRLIDELDIDATCIVISDDDKHLKIADNLSFPTIRRNNLFLGRKFNDGYAEAARLGYKYVFPIGSDSWIDSCLFDNLDLEDDEIRIFMNYSVINAKGTYRADMNVLYHLGCGYMFPTELIAEVDYRPCEEFLRKGCDTSTHKMLIELGGKRFYTSSHRLQHIGFRSGKNQVTDLEALLKKFESHITFDPFSDLYKIYDKDLVDRIKKYYKSGRALKA